MATIKREELTVRKESALLAGVSLPDRPADDYPEPLAELRGLAQTAGARVLGNVVQRRQKPDMATYIGKGKLEELDTLAKANGADVIIFDNELEPAQLRNIEKKTDTKVVDRTELILDIFAARAHTSQARLQVELAQLEYLRPRLRRMWTHLERHGGGIGTRGPGEQQLETDRRLIDKKIRDLRARLEVVQARKEREVRARSVELRVSLVGYTNAGKSTLMNRLTDANVLVADKLFATLDTRTRQWNVPGLGKVLLSDTVGFIRNLPHDLVASFKATLEETTHADLLLHVVDAANPTAVSQIEAVNLVLEEIAADQTPTILVLNQTDRISDPTVLTALEKLHPRTVAVSAKTNDGIDQLERMVAEALADRYRNAVVECHAGNGKLLAYLAAHGQIDKKTYIDDRAQVHLRMAKHLLDRINPVEATVRVKEPLAPDWPANLPEPTLNGSH